MLIDRDSLLKKFESGALLFQPDVRKIIESMPVIDAEPVRHGRWIERKNYPGLAYHCSECNYQLYGRPYQNTYLIVPYNFCPNCGAKMDGGKSDE